MSLGLSISARPALPPTPNETCVCWVQRLQRARREHAGGVGRQTEDEADEDGHEPEVEGGKVEEPERVIRRMSEWRRAK